MKKNKFKTYSPQTEDEFVKCFDSAKPGDTIDMTEAIRNERQKAREKSTASNKSMDAICPQCNGRGGLLDAGSRTGENCHQCGGSGKLHHR